MTTTLTWFAPACLTDVRQRLLDDAVERGLDIRREAHGPSLVSTCTSSVPPSRTVSPRRRSAGSRPKSSSADGRSSTASRRTLCSVSTTRLPQLAAAAWASSALFGALDRGEAEQDRRQRLPGLVVQLAGEPLPLRLLRLHGAAQRVALHAARVLDRHRGLRGEQRDDLLVLVGEAALGLLLGEVEVPERDAPRHHRARRESCAWADGSAGTRPRAGRGMRSSRRSGRGVLDQHAEDAAAARELADRSPVRLADPEGDEALQLVAAPVDHAERRVARARQLGGDPDQRLQDGVEGQLRGDRDPGLDEPPPPLIAVHAAIQPCWPRSRTRLQADFTAMPPVPKPPTAKSGRNRTLLIALAVAAVVVAALIAASVLRSGGDDGDSAATTAATETTGDRDDPEQHHRPGARARGRDPAERNACSGKPGTTVRMLQFEDLQCPICKRYTDDAFPAIVNEYVRTGRIKIDFRGLAFLGPDSLKALKIAMAAGLQNKLWQVVGLFYANQGAENSGWVTDSLIDQILAEVPGLDAAKVKVDAKSAKVANQIAAVQAEATKLEGPGNAVVLSRRRLQPAGQLPAEVVDPERVPHPHRPGAEGRLALSRGRIGALLVATPPKVVRPEAYDGESFSTLLDDALGR